MNKILRLCILSVGLIGTQFMTFDQTVAQSASYMVPDFAGRDKAFRSMRTRIVKGLREGANFSGHYTIVIVGCGTGCSANYIVNRKTGKVGKLPWGGEQNYMLNLRYNLRSNQIFATWYNDDLCVGQAGTWNGAAIVISSAPRVQPERACRF